MKTAEVLERLGPELAAALEKRGYSQLTPVQVSVLDPAFADRDLRISSQTGSGKTVAIGLALRDLLQPSSRSAVAAPRALVVVPTRELAKQVEAELAWLYAERRVRVAAVTGGANYRDEHRSLASGPGVVVGTPGRLLDHLRRGSLSAEKLAAVVLDEADRMLDLGFREELDAILAFAPEGHRTHLVSATFAREVAALADRAQHDPVHVQGTPLGSANQDIEHVVHPVLPRERVSALINLLLAEPGGQMLIFARTRADVASVSEELASAGFRVATLSGEMEQPARNRALAAFKRGELDALVATDVAARGIDVQDIARVVQLEPPSDPESYTHRSGRTGRAGRKGISSVLVSPAAFARTSSLLRRAGVKFRVEPIPSAAQIREQRAQRWYDELTGESWPREAPAAASLALAERILASGHAARALARLLTQALGPAAAAPRELTPVQLDARRAARAPARREERNASAPGRWETFRVSWGEAHGADARRLLAMLCRRGGVRSGDIGAIHVAATHSLVEIAADVARDFARAASVPDARDRRVLIEPAPTFERGPARVRERREPRGPVSSKRQAAVSDAARAADAKRAKRAKRKAKRAATG